MEWEKSRSPKGSVITQRIVGWVIPTTDSYSFSFLKSIFSVLVIQDPKIMWPPMFFKYAMCYTPFLSPEILSTLHGKYPTYSFRANGNVIFLVLSSLIPSGRIAHYLLCALIKLSTCPHNYTYQVLLHWYLYKCASLAILGCSLSIRLAFINLRIPRI